MEGENMRNAQKASLLEIIQTLHEAHETVKTYISRNDLEPARTLLCECQQTAFQIGTAIEESEGDDVPAVRLLETYCEELYRVCEGIPEDITARKAYKRLSRALLQVQHSVRNHIPVRLEVVFLSYKASMFDSFESVWKAADADPNCDAYVIPIPYYDKNPDGSFGQFHYEGGMYPDDVPVIRYDLYDFEKRRPDAIFIHNGYDNYNYVTSVHPDFYSTRLRKFTKLLLYIPYFITVNSVSEGLCTVSGCWNADRVFVQSEKIRQEYIEAFRKLKQPDTGDEEELEKKFVALGSPKFDKAISARPEEFDLPEQWSRLVTKPDGTRKKIVFYNTSIASMLQENERYLEKLRSVLKTFQGRSDAVLWWRPHPLLESTFRSMRPQLLPEYLQIVQHYQQGGWGIFDTTADANRAAAYADYYYGDSGSALQATFQAAGKPVMIQRVVPAAGNRFVPLILGVYGQQLYFSPLQSSAILCLDLSSGEITAVKSGHSTPWRPYCRGVKTGETLYFTPTASDAVLKLEVESQQFSAIPYELDVDRLRKSSPQYQKGWNFSWSFIHGGEVFFVGSYPAIMCLNIHSGEITYAADWPAAFQTSDSSIVVSGCCQMGEQLVLTGGSSVIACFNMSLKSFSAEEIRHEHAKSGFSAAAYGDGCLWLMARDDGTVLRYDPSTGEIAAYGNFPAGVRRCENMCCTSVYERGSLWLFSFGTNAVLRLCAKTGEMSVVRMFPSGQAVHIGGSLVVENGKIYISRLDYHGFTIYDLETAAYVDVPVQVSAETAVAATCCGGEDAPKNIQDTVILENGLDTIETLLSTTVKNHRELIAEWIASPDGRAGERIYLYARNMVLSNQT